MIKEEVDRYDYFADQQRSESIVNDKENREENYRFKINLWKKYFLRNITEERLWNIRLGLHHCGSEQAAWGWKIRLIKQNKLGFSVVNKYKLDLSGLDLSICNKLPRSPFI